MSRISFLIKTIILIGVFYFLTACGSGDANSPTDEFIIPDLSSSSFDQYTGEITAAEVTNESLKLFVSYIFSDDYNTWNIDSNNGSSAVSSKINKTTKYFIKKNIKSERKNTRERVTIADSLNCFISGTEVVEGVINDDATGVINITYNHCNNGYTIWHGSVTINIINAAFDKYESDMYFKKLLIEDENNSYKLSGRMHSNESYGSSLNDLVIDMVLIDQNSLIQLKFENYITSTCEYCSQSDLSFNGRIYHSNLGFIDVSTTGVLKDANSYYSQEYIGELKFEGGNNTSALLNFEQTEVVRYSTINEKKYLVRIQLDKDGDSLYEDDVVIPSSLAYEYEIYDIGDNDGDGMPNGWEGFYGLNPDSNQDASLDADNDGFSNQLEYFRYGNPNDNTSVPIVTDLSIQTTISTEIARAGRPQNIGFGVINPNPEYGATGITLTLTKSSNVDWYKYSGCTLSTVNTNQLICFIDYITQDSGRGFTVSIVGEPVEFTVRATVTSTTYDSDLANNVGAAQGVFNQRQANIGLMPDYISSLNPHNDVAVIDYTHAFDIYLSNWGPDPALNSVFRMNIPDNVSVLSANYFIRGILAGSCVIDTEIVCNMGTLQQQGGSSIGFVRLEVVGDQQGYGDYTASLVSDAIENDITDNEFSKQIYVGLSLAPIQAQINSATGPITINLNAGMHVGALNFSGKQVTLIGHATQGATLLRTESPIESLSNAFFLESDSTIRNIYFQGRDYIDKSTNVIRFFGSNILIENNIFENNGYNNIGIEGFGDNINIKGNIFRHSSTSLSCSLIYLSGNGSYRIENNLMHDTGCSAIVLSNLFTSPDIPNKHVITNNTIVNNALGISDNVVVNGSISKIQNNILVGNDLAIEINLNDLIGIYQYSYVSPQIINNLFFENITNLLLPESIGFSLFDTGNNINQDPQFLNATDFSLHSSSVAIDSGINIDSPAKDINQLPRPVDGNADSFFDTDIGAYEYDPF